MHIYNAKEYNCLGLGRGCCTFTKQTAKIIFLEIKNRSVGCRLGGVHGYQCQTNIILKDKYSFKVVQQVSSGAWQR